MKKILFIFLLFISVTMAAQVESSLTMKGSSAETDTLRVIKDNESALMLKSTFTSGYANVFSNGLTLATKTLTLGGAISANTALTNTGESYSFNLRAGTSATDKSAQLSLQSGTMNLFGYDTVNYNDPSFSKYSRLRLSGSLVSMTHFGTVSNTKSLAISSGSMTVTDALDSQGLLYAADYSANYTARSLVDSSFAAGLASTPYTFSNGLTEAANAPVLGGAITENTTITNTGESYALKLRAGTSLTDKSSELILQSGGLNLFSYDTVNYNSPSFSKYSRINLSGSFVGLYSYTEAAVIRQIYINSTSIVIADPAGMKGAVYADDYSANYSARSIVDKAYVDAVAGSGLDTIEANTLMRFKEDTVGLYLVPVGMGMPTDTGHFQFTATYGMIYHASPDTLNVTQSRMICRGSSPDFTYQVYWGANITSPTDSLFTAAHQVAGAEATTTGELDTATNNAEIPPDVYIWWEILAVTAKPTLASLNIIGSNISGR